ncbi:unnamed protein product [Mytilus edulis]|uniref:Uncharacterized protein n=1 Tax=Mytilus edulis TaxID=6550 RepID=A0A8S3SNK7_MYTED|nr:unnamed protein product [Mytilus edulis]
MQNSRKPDDMLPEQPGLRGKEAEESLKNLKLRKCENQTLVLIKELSLREAHWKTSRKRTDRSDIEDKENNNISRPTPAKICKPAETKEQRLKKIKDVLQDLMSENGETITISVEPEADKVEEDTSSQILEEGVELHVKTEVNTLEKQITITKVPPLSIIIRIVV